MEAENGKDQKLLKLIEVNNDTNLEQCKICQKSYKGAHRSTRLRLLFDHIERSHLKLRSYVCDYCNHTFNSKTQKASHISMKHREEHKNHSNYGRYESICGQYRKYIKNLQCLFCGGCFNKEIEAVKHVLRVHKEKIHLDIEKEMSESSVEPKLPEQIHLDIKKEVSESSVEPKLPVVIRFAKRDPIMKSDDPDQSISKKNDKIVQRNHKKFRYQCQYCNKVTNDKGNHARHEYVCSKFGRYFKDGKCLFCCKSFKLRHMYRHITIAHRDHIDTEVLQELDDESSKCKNCGKMYRRAMQRRYHESICRDN